MTVRAAFAACATAAGLALGTLAADIAAAGARAAAQPSRGDAAPTFTRDIARLVFTKCATCHHPEGTAPFSLLTYADVRQRATQIAEVTGSRYMPPWKADPSNGPFVGQHPLTDAEIERIRRWVDAGAIEGDPADLPPVPDHRGRWRLGQPDLVITLDEPYRLQPDGTDVFRIFVIDVPIDAVRFVKGFEFLPGNPRIVHHANIRIDATDASRRYDLQEPGPGYDGLIAHAAVYPDGHFLGWTPGQVAPLLPKGLGWRLQPGTDLVVELHMQPSGKPEDVQPQIGLYFGDDPPARTPAMLRLGRQSIDIPAGEARYTIGDSFVLPVDVEVQAVQPHAHYRAREIRGMAMLPDGTARTLIHIRDWDFRWQHVYRYATPFHLPRGTRLSMEITYDNSAVNPRNPYNPPRRTFWGQRSADEMGDLWIQVLPGSERDREALLAAFGPKVLAEDVIGYEREIARDPTSVALHDDVGMLYLRLDRPAEAVAHFEASARLQPESAAAKFNLGTALAIAGRFDEAEGRYREALRIRPDYALAHNNLGGMLLRRGALGEAVDHIGRALELDPGNTEARANATLAVRVVAAAVEAEPSAAGLDLLARTHAAAGDFGRAIEAAERALQADGGDSAAIRRRLDEYRRRR